MPILTEPEDLKWLNETHNVSTYGYKVAVLHGNEDYPTKVELFAKDHFRCKPTVYEPDEDGTLRLVKFGTGQPPKEDTE